MRLLFFVWFIIGQIIICRSIPRHHKLQTDKKHGVTSTHAKIRTRQPIIGVLAQSTKHEPFENTGKSYIVVSYIKFLESAGARVVPVRNDLSQDEVEKLFHSINGFLLPGGWPHQVNTGYRNISEQIFNLAQHSFHKGEYFPIWGACLGFEMLAILASQDEKLVSPTDSRNLAIPLNFTRGYKKGRMFRNIPQDMVTYLSRESSTFNNHNYSILTKKFNTNKKLNNFFHVLTTNTDRKGVEFVSTIEGIKYPIYGTQWHPEKNPYEWSWKLNIPHDAMAIRVSQYFANFFVNEARYNSHKFKTPEQEETALIHNFNPLYTGNISSFQQCYFFN